MYRTADIPIRRISDRHENYPRDAPGKTPPDP